MGEGGREGRKWMSNSLGCVGVNAWRKTQTEMANLTGLLKAENRCLDGRDCS